MTPLDMSSGRHYHMPPTPVLWNCQRCNAENAGPLDQGCMNCGNGKPQPAVPPVSTSAMDLPTVILRGFERWLEQRCEADENPTGVLKLRSILLEAFTGGFMLQNVPAGTPIPPARPEEPPMTEDGKQARTLAAALALFIENILVNLPEESDTGEWMTLKEAKELLVSLQEEGRR